MAYEYCTKNWWQGFNASEIGRRKRPPDWLAGFEAARVVERRLDAKRALASNGYDPRLCVNCLEPMPDGARVTALTCCNACQQIAEGVRGLRRWVSYPGEVLNMDEISQRQRFTLCAISRDGYDKRGQENLT